MCLSLFPINFVLKRICSYNGSDRPISCAFENVISDVSSKFQLRFHHHSEVYLKFSPAKGLEIILKYTSKLKFFMNTYLLRSLFAQQFVFKPSRLYQVQGNGVIHQKGVITN